MRTIGRLLAVALAIIVLLVGLTWAVLVGLFAPAAAVLGIPQGNDTQGVTIAIAAPANDAIVKDIQALTVKVNDPDKIRVVQYQIENLSDNTQETVTGYDNTARDFSYSWDTTKLTKDPNVRITATALLKTAGGSVNSASITVHVNNKGKNNSTATSPTKSAEKAPAREVGPGDCLNGAGILKDNPNATRSQLKAKWTAQLGNRANDACVAAMAKSVKVKPAKLVDFINNNTCLRPVPKGGLTVQNTYFDRKTGRIVNWKVQTFPEGELVFFACKNGKADMAHPLFKFACGNVLKPVPHAKVTPPTKETPPTKTTPPSKCKSNCGSTPPPPTGCKSDCGTTPPPPTGCKENCTTPPPPPAKCTTPNPHEGDSNYTWDANSCTSTKKPQSDDCMLNGGSGCPPNGGHQDVQNNSTSGVNTGKTPGAPDSVSTDTPHPVNNRGDNGKVDKAPDPTTNGSNSGSSDGKGTPSGSTTDSSGTTGDSSGNGNGHVTDNTEVSNSVNSGSVSTPSD